VPTRSTLFRLLVLAGRVDRPTARRRAKELETFLDRGQDSALDFKAGAVARRSQERAPEPAPPIPRRKRQR